MLSEIQKLYDVFEKYPAISTDSRNIVKDSIFFALKGDHFDGNEFAMNALEDGASFAVIDNPRFKTDNRFILVENVLNTLQLLAGEHRKKLNIPVIGITGSNGKTTTKELIAAVLSTQYNCRATKGNLNNHIGVPLTLLSMNCQTEIAVVEMGANHIGEIDDLCRIAVPDFGIITNIGKAHLEGFLTIENIIQTKSALYRSVEKFGKTVFVNADDSLLMTLSDKQNRYTYSRETAGDVNAHLICTDVYLTLEWMGHVMKTNLFGVYNIYNVLAAITIGKYFKISDDNIVKAIKSYNPVNNRSQLIKTKRNTVVMDAYNANPTSMEAAIKSFLVMNSDSKVLILGDMLELGNDSLQEHKNIISLIANQGIRDVFLVGEMFSAAADKHFKTFGNVDALKAYLEEKHFVEKTILVKGSRGIRLETALPAL